MAKFTIDLSDNRIWRYKFDGDRKVVDDYVFIWCENIYKAEHRLVVEKAIGRELKSHEEVHHVNGDKGNNSNRNLVLCDRPYHKYLDICRALESIKKKSISLGRLKLKARLERKKKAFLSKR